MRKQGELKPHSLSDEVSEEEAAAAGFTRRSVEEQPAQPELGGRAIRNTLLHTLAMRMAGRGIVSLLLTLIMLAGAATSPAQVAISVTFGPPALPVYSQPFCPGPGYIWTPGYWAWDPSYGYYWVPGTWVMAPFAGALWTPGYWGWNDGAYFWHSGYWGPQVGFYGGINYGFGYTGEGYEGGYWRRGAFYYNRAVNNVNVTNVKNVYNRTVINNVRVNRVSYNGGRGGIMARPTAAQLTAARQRRFALLPAQRQQELAARSNPMQRAAANHGRPAIAATPRAGAFTGRGVVRARAAGAPYRTPAARAVRRASPRPANPAGTGRRPLITAPRRATSPRVERSVPSQPAPARRTYTPGPPRTERSTPSRREPTQRTYRSGGPRTTGPRQNAAPRPMMRQRSQAHPGEPRPRPQGHAQPQQPRTPHPSQRDASERHQPGQPHE
jgi:hypothetical protein